MNLILATASFTGFITFFVHWRIGGIYAVRPLLAAADLTPASRWLNYFCWHIVTVLLLILALTLAAAAAGKVSTDTLMLVALISASISALSVAVTLRAGIHPLRFPATYLLAIVAALTIWGAGL